MSRVVSRCKLHGDPAPQICSTSADQPLGRPDRAAPTSARRAAGRAGPLHVELEDRRGGRRDAATAARPAPRTSSGRAAAPRRWIATSRVVRSLSAAIGSSSVATMRADSSSFSNLPRTSSIASALDEAARACRTSPGTPRPRRCRADVVQHEDRHAVALLRLERAQAGDDAADPDVGLRGGQLGDAPGAERLQLLGEAIERMAAHVEAERFLLDGELLRLGPGRRVGQRDRRRRRSSLAAAERAATAPCRGRAGGGCRARSPCRRPRRAARGATATGPPTPARASRARRP